MFVMTLLDDIVGYVPGATSDPRNNTGLHHYLHSAQSTEGKRQLESTRGIIKHLNLARLPQ